MNADKSDNNDEYQIENEHNEQISSVFVSISANKEEDIFVQIQIWIEKS